MRRALIALAMMGCLILRWGSTSCHALSIDFGMPALEVMSGSDFTVDLLADIDESERIILWDIDLLFENSQIEFLGSVRGDDWNPIPPVSDYDVSIAGIARFERLQTGGIHGQDVLLATLSFKSLTADTALLGIGTDDLFEGFQLASSPMFAFWDSTPLTISQTSAPVPEPATMFLLGLGLLALGGIKKRKWGKHS